MSRPRLRPVRLTVAFVVCGAVALLVVWPQGLGASRWLLLAQIVAFRGELGIAAGIGAVVFATIALVRKSWGVAAGTAVALAVATVANGALWTASGGPTPAPPERLTVIAWNTQGGAVPPARMAALVGDAAADVVSLPETDRAAAGELARLLGERGHRMTAHTATGQEGLADLPTSVLIADRLGEYREDVAAGSTPGLPSGVWRPVGGDGPTIVAAHPFPPLPSSMDTWRAGLDWVAQRCDGPDVIVAGDLNATVDHMSGLGGAAGLIGECDDAATAAGAAAGTWPATVPPWLGAPIDHVLVGSGWRVHEVRVDTSFDGEGSDHRPIVAVLSAS